MVILAGVLLVTYLGIGISSWADLALVAGEVVTGVFYLVVVVAETLGRIFVSPGE